MEKRERDEAIYIPTSSDNQQKEIFSGKEKSHLMIISW